MSKLHFVLQTRVLLKNSVQPIKHWLSVSNLSSEIQKHFLFQVVEELTRRGAMLHLALSNVEGLVWNVKLRGSLGFSDLGMVEFEDFRAVRREHSRLSTPGFRRADQPLQGSAWLSIMQ